MEAIFSKSLTHKKNGKTSGFGNYFWLFKIENLENLENLVGYL